MDRRQFLAAVAASSAAAASPFAMAQDWPANPVRWVVPTHPEAAPMCWPAPWRVHAQDAEPDHRGGQPSWRLDQYRRPARCLGQADGYTIMSADNAILAFNEHLFSKLPFSPDKDFTYVGGISRFPMALVVNPAFEAKDFKEFLAYAKANPGKLNYASPGNGSPHHLAMELFKNRTGTSLTHIPYKGAAPALADVMGGQVPCMFLDLASGLPVIQSGKVRALAIGTAKRVPNLPNVPTLAELGLKDSEVYAFQGILGPKGLPPAIVQRLNADLQKLQGPRRGQAHGRLRHGSPARHARAVPPAGAHRSQALG
jgi:tripartite-type tricarboxylate transporter receptor subunit TctC